MYCENCGSKLQDNNVYCSECGCRVKNIVANKTTNSNKTLWIVLISVFGGIFLVIALSIIFFTFLIVTENSVDSMEEVDIREPYPYYDDIDDIERIDKI